MVFESDGVLKDLAVVDVVILVIFDTLNRHSRLVIGFIRGLRHNTAVTDAIKGQTPSTSCVFVCVCQFISGKTE